MQFDAKYVRKAKLILERIFTCNSWFYTQYDMLNIYKKSRNCFPNMDSIILYIFCFCWRKPNVFPLPSDLFAHIIFEGNSIHYIVIRDSRRNSHRYYKLTLLSYIVNVLFITKHKERRDLFDFLVSDWK